MRLIFLARFSLTILLVLPAVASAQTFGVRASAGPTITDSGYSFAAGVSVSPASPLAIVASVERTHLYSQFSTDAQGVMSAFRGGTLTLGTVEVQIVPRGRDRVGPYALAGFAAGISRPNVNERFPNPVTNDVRAIFAGGGVLVPVREHAAFFVDARLMGGAEGVEGVVAVAPVRAGFAWSF